MRLPPPGAPGTHIGIDAEGRVCLLRWNVPGAPGVWTALWFDDRDYPCARALASPPRVLVPQSIEDWPPSRPLALEDETRPAPVPDEIHPSE